MITFDKKPYYMNKEAARFKISKDALLRFLNIFNPKAAKRDAQKAVRAAEMTAKGGTRLTKKQAQLIWKDAIKNGDLKEAERLMSAGALERIPSKDLGPIFDKISKFNGYDTLTKAEKTRLRMVAMELELPPNQFLADLEKLSKKTTRPANMNPIKIVEKDLKRVEQAEADAAAKKRGESFKKQVLKDNKERSFRKGQKSELKWVEEKEKLDAAAASGNPEAIAKAKAFEKGKPGAINNAIHGITDHPFKATAGGIGVAGAGTGIGFGVKGVRDLKKEHENSKALIDDIQSGRIDLTTLEGQAEFYSRSKASWIYDILVRPDEHEKVLNVAREKINKANKDAERVAAAKKLEQEEREDNVTTAVEIPEDLQKDFTDKRTQAEPGQSVEGYNKPVKAVEPSKPVKITKTSPAVSDGKKDKANKLMKDLLWYGGGTGLGAAAGALVSNRNRLRNAAIGGGAGLLTSIVARKMLSDDLA